MGNRLKCGSKTADSGNNANESRADLPGGKYGQIWNIPAGQNAVLKSNEYWH
jgi:hypothetical protein